MNIRLLRKSEINNASWLVRLNYSKRYESIAHDEIAAMFERESYKPSYMVAEDQGHIIGFAGYGQSWMDFRVYHIFWVNVHPEHQGRGVGSLLVSAVIRKIKARHGRDKKASVVLITTTAPAFYGAKFGFRPLLKLDKSDFLMALSLAANVHLNSGAAKYR